jgi:hypothetical protein
MATFINPITVPQDGQQVDAAIVNQPLQQLQGNCNYLLGLLDQISGVNVAYARQVPVASNVLLGQPVFWNPVTVRYEQAAADCTVRQNVVGVCAAAQVNGLADLIVTGYAALLLTNALTAPVQAGRYYLSATPGQLSQTFSTTQVLYADGQGNVFVAPKYQDPGNSLTTAAGLTSNAFVQLFTTQLATGFFADGAVANMDTVNGLNVLQAATDAFGNSDSTTLYVGPGDWLRLSSKQSCGIALPPFLSYTVSVQSAVAGSPAAFNARLTKSAF